MTASAKTVASPDPDRSVARVLDEAVMEILRAKAEGRVVSELWLNPAVYAEVARAKEREVARGNPLTLLDLEVVDSEMLEAGTVRVV